MGAAGQVEQLWQTCQDWDGTHGMKTKSPELDQATDRRLRVRSRIWKDLAQITILAALYFILGRVGLLFSFSRPSITPVWLPSGIAIAALLVLGYRVWPGILLGALAVELTLPSGLLTAVFLAVTNTLESLTGAWLANRYAHGRNFYLHPKDVMKFTVLVGMLTPLISPPLGAATVSWDRFILSARDASTGLIWWLGDVVSLLVVAPLIIVWSARPYRTWKPRQALEFALLLLLLIVLAEAIFGPAAPASLRGYLFSYLCLPVLFWAAFRFAERELMTATFVLGAVVMWDTLQGYGLFEHFAREKALLVYQGFMATASGLSLCLGAVVGQRRRATEDLQRAHKELELRVQQRTEALQTEIAERKVAEEALRESEYRYALAQRAANVGSWDWNIQTGELHWSEQIEPMFGFAHGEFDRSYQSFLERVHPDDRPTVTDAVDKAVRESRDYRVEHRIVWPDATVRWVAAEGEVHRDARGAAVRMLGIVRDITGRKQMEEALRINLTKYSVLFESFPLGISVTDENGKIVEANTAAERLLGVAAPEHIQRQVDSKEWQIIGPDRTPMPAGEYASVRAMQEGKRVENVEMGIVKAHDQVTWISVTAQPLPLAGYGVVITYSDITARKRTEEELQRSEATLRGILDAAKESIWLFSPDGEILLGNATAVERFGCLPSKLIGRHFSELMPAELAAARMARLREVVESGHPVEFEDERSHILFHHSFYPVLDADSRVVSIACFSRNVTRLRQAQQALRASQERLKLAQQAGRIGTFDRNLQTGETIWSEEMNALCGLPPGTPGVSFAEWEKAIHPEDLPRVRENIRLGIAKRSTFQMEFRLYWPDRSLHWIEARGKVLCDESGQPIRTVGMNMDITERKQLQQALEEANRELQDTNRSLQAVTEELRLSNETLEGRVAEQTAELRQANQILRMILECNQALVHIYDERQLIIEICRIINDVGGYRMAWVGFAESDDARSVRPFAAVGFGEDYVEKIKVSWGENRLGLGPTGTAIRTGKVCLGKDFLTNPNLEPWRKLALEHGFRSSIALPLLSKDGAFGAVTIYASEPDAFNEKQVNLLTDLAEDMAFGITALRAHAERDRVRQELEQRTLQLQALGLQLVHAEQLERRRLAQILHDSLQQLLVGARYNLEVLRRQGSGQDFASAILRLDGLLAECIQISRSLTAELSPPILYEAGLASALRWLGRWFGEIHGLMVRVEATEEIMTEPEDVRFALFLAVRELLFNVVKHAGVQQAQVRLTLLRQQQVRILVSDKGSGFDPSTLHSQKTGGGGLGLFSLRERLELLGGSLTVKTAPGCGTRFSIVVPLRNQPPS